MTDDRCYECTGNGDNYCKNENGEWISSCEDCSYAIINVHDRGDDSLCKKNLCEIKTVGK